MKVNAQCTISGYQNIGSGNTSCVSAAQSSTLNTCYSGLITGNTISNGHLTLNGVFIIDS